MTIEELRAALIDYFGTAMANGNPMAVIELGRAQTATDAELIELARRAGMNITVNYFED